MKRTLFFFTLLIFSSAAYTQQMTEDGKCFPREPITSGMTQAMDDIGDFTIIDSDGTTHNLYDELDAGNTVLIDLFSTTWGACQTYTSVIEEAYVNNGSGEDGVLFWGLTPYDSDGEINAYKAAYGVTNPCAGVDGGGPEAIDIVIEGQPFYGYPTYLVICPNRTVYFNVCWPPTATCFDQYFDQCAPELSVTPSIRNVLASKGITTFNIFSNMDWTVAESITWLDVAITNGTGNKTLKVNYNENATGSTRSGGITISSTDGSRSEIVAVSQVSYSTHSINLSEGWNSLSSYIMPVHNSIIDVFDPIVGSLVIAKTETGVYFPTGLENTIGEWESQSAYKVKMDAPATLQIIGVLEANKTLALSAGWNLIPVICDYPMDAASILGTLDLELVKDVAGKGVYWPDLNINTLGNLEPGKAYYILLNTGGSITFPANAE